MEQNFEQKQEVNTATAPETKVTTKKKNIFGIVGLILGCIGLVFCLFGAGIYLAIPALVLSILGLTLANKKNMKKGIAIVALVFSALGVIIGAVAMNTSDDTAEATTDTVPAYTAESVVEVTTASTETVDSEESTAAESTEAVTAESTETVAEQTVEEVNYEVGEGKAVMYTNSIGTTWIQIAVPVKNTGNTNLYLSSGTMDLEDVNGAFVDTVSMVSVYPQVLCPGETAWYYEETTVEFAEQELKVVPHVDVEKATVKCKRLELSEVSVGDEKYGGIEVKGRVQNNTDEEQNFVYVTAAFYDEDGEFLTVAYTILSDAIAAGDKIGFSANTFAAPDDITADRVANYEIYAYPNQYQW